ncbi:hypothetical protein [Sulfitobacter donghicola]|uniref:Uncharacterized protein n=1 Tax=Sulfitobacter donghicola DSW-25 = KCTC 12864 = JCM 14565 TaxID=1300350 RepID=A0A073INC6_9RHOB|nr:hypothetical protein [Sulfitobacter donghicola]KEJ91045.1 hypothetical protein DSW25_00630 [Sulfitobacter donghicola DSW-25 = KCTC 12864 = JCM 14565]KIN67693.1 putative ATP-dependent DNA helicase [Sulfitobacter donghicola DSW-25 = KCTC 12864 = JCM 14565]
MDLESVTLRLPRELLSGAQRVATAQDVSVGHMVRQLLKREVDRQVLAGGSKVSSDSLLDAFRVLVGRDLAEAADWSELTTRLRLHGYAVHKEGDDIALIKKSCGTKLCHGRDIGYPYADLKERLGPIPAHPKCSMKTETMPAGRIDATRLALLKNLFAEAKSWPDLINRLAVEGMELRPVGAGLAIYVTSTGRHLCNLGALGLRYQTLVKRFRAAMPGHPLDVTGYLAPDGFVVTGA